MAADNAPNADPGVNTGKQARTPSDNSVGVKGAPGNGTSTGEMGTSSSDAAAGVKGLRGNKNGPSVKAPGAGSFVDLMWEGANRKLDERRVR